MSQLETTDPLQGDISTSHKTLLGISSAELIAGWKRLSLMFPHHQDILTTDIQTGEEQMADIKGVGPNAPLKVLPNGAASSSTPYRFDLLPSLALAEVARIMAAGAEKYGEGNWKLLPANDHLNHAMQHIFAHTAGDTQEADELEHACHVATRVLFWLECLIADRDNLEPKGVVVYTDKNKGYWDAAKMWHDGDPPEGADPSTYTLSSSPAKE